MFYSSEVIRVAREVGTEGKLDEQGSGQRRLRRVERSDGKHEPDGGQSYKPGGSTHPRCHHGRGQRRLVQKKSPSISRGEILQLKEAINTMVEQLRSFASGSCNRVAREIGTEGRLGGQGRGAEAWREHGWT